MSHHSKTSKFGSLIDVASLMQVDRSVSDLHGLRLKQLKSPNHRTVFNSSKTDSAYDMNPVIPKLAFAPRKPDIRAHPSNSPVASSRRLHHTTRNSDDTNNHHRIEKIQLDEIKLLRMTVEQLAKDRDNLLLQNTELLNTTEMDVNCGYSNGETSKIKHLAESNSQSLGLYSCEMIDPMKKMPRSIRLRVLAQHRRHSPTKTIISKPDSFSLANIADYASEPAQRVAYTSGRLMAQYLLNADANDNNRFHSLTTYCRTRLAHSRKVEHRSLTTEIGKGRQALNAVVNPFTLATACHCMKRLIEACPMYQEVMNEAFAEIMVGLYAPDTIHYSDASQSSETHEIKASFQAEALRRHLQNIPYCELNRYVGADLLLAQSELVDSWALAKRVLLVEDSLSLIIKKQQQTYQALSRRNYFNAWLDALHCRKIWRENFVQKATRKNKLLQESKAFFAWQACMSLADLEKNLADLTAAIADEKRVLGGEMWNLQDQIKHSEEELSKSRLQLSHFATLHDNALLWRKRSVDTIAHVAGIFNHCNESKIRFPFPINSIFELFPEEQTTSNQQSPASTSTFVRIGSVTDASLQTASSRPATSNTSRPGTGNLSSSRPGSSHRPGSAGQLATVEMMVGRLLASPAEESIARLVLAGTGVALAGWSDKEMLSGLLHSKMLDFMQMQQFETVHKDPEATADVWTSVLSRAKHLGAVFNDSLTTPESLTAKPAAARCILMADIILNCGCSTISPLWLTFRQRFASEEYNNNCILVVHKRLQHLDVSRDGVHDLAHKEDAVLNASLEEFIKECPNACEAALSAYQDATVFATCSRMVQDHLRKWFSVSSLKLGRVVHSKLHICSHICS
jgi:hypothetical protein